MKPNGIVVWQGPSQLDGVPIVVVATGLVGRASRNAKTGAMVQTWIMRQDVAPHVAVKDGRDVSICGDCKHRPSTGGACYVRVFQGPRSVWQAWQRGRYAVAADADAVRAVGAGRVVRLGSYGDPAAVPVWVWNALTADATSHTGYTHQWHRPHGATLQGLCMASADTAEERDVARSQGWRTFRVRLASEALGERESVCPASEEAGKKTNCATCGACNGAATGRKGSIAIVAHGGLASRYIAIRRAA